MRYLLLSVLILLCVQGNTAFFCEIFNTCSKTTNTSEPVLSATPIASQNSTSIASPTIASTVASTVAPTVAPTTVIPPSSTQTANVSSVASSAIPSPVSSATPTTTLIPSSTPPSLPSSTFVPTTTSQSTTSTYVTPSAIPTQSADSGSSNTGVIVGSVCGFVAIIGAGFAYAFFSKTRRNDRDKRLYSQSDDNYGNYPHQDLYSRPSPALAASAAAAADNIHGHTQWDNNTSYNYAPQAPMAAVAKHDPYYSTAPVSQMGYPASDPYYNTGQQQYYDPNGAYYGQQQHYDPQYVDSQKQQYEPYAQQHRSPVLVNTSTPVTTSSNVYSVPHSYSNEPNSNENHR